MAVKKMKAGYVPFASAPFPYTGRVPTTGKKFLNAVVNGRRGHLSARGGFYAEDTTYSDNNVLLALPGGFDPDWPAMIVVYFHGNQSRLERDVVRRQRVLAQLQASRLNAALVVPQFAVDALDSSAGKFYGKGAFARFLAEASGKLADLWGARVAAQRFAQMPVVLVAYSGGYNPAAYAVSRGAVSDRVAGIVLLDALYGEIDRFADWIAANNRSAFFFSAYRETLVRENDALRESLEDERIRSSTGLPKVFLPGEVVFLETPKVEHLDYVTRAWVVDPLTDLLNRIPGFPRG